MTRAAPWLALLVAGCIVDSAPDDDADGADGGGGTEPAAVYGEPCEIPSTPEIDEACRPPDDLTASCVLEGDASCPGEACLLWEGGDPYCSERCSAERTCPSGARCLELLGDEPCAPGVAERLLCVCVRVE